MANSVPSKTAWNDGIGAAKSPRRLHIATDADGLLNRPVYVCDHTPFKSQQGCQKHVYNKHGWFNCFDKKPCLKEVFLERMIRRSNQIPKCRKSRT